jgi:hypothetical protein
MIQGASKVLAPCGTLRDGIASHRGKVLSRELSAYRTVEWWRRGESEYSVVLKTRKLLIFREAKNAENGEITANWNVSGTRAFHPLANFVRMRWSAGSGAFGPIPTLSQRRSPRTGEDWNYQPLQHLLETAAERPPA